MNEKLNNIFENILSNKLTQVAIIIILSVIVYKILKNIFEKNMKRLIANKKLDNKKRTYIRMFSNVLKYIFILFVIVLILQINGINVSAIITGVGVMGIIVGFALQDTLKDLIMGVNIILEDYFKIGDVVKYNDIQGKVIFLGLKTTKIKDIDNDDIISISNRNIDQVSKVSEWLDINVPVSYDNTVIEVESVINKIKEHIKEFEHVTGCEYKGINEFADSSINYKVRIFCNPEFKPEIRRKALRTIKLAFDDNNIKIPYTQIDIHNIN